MLLHEWDWIRPDSSLVWTSNSFYLHMHVCICALLSTFKDRQREQVARVIITAPNTHIHTLFLSLSLSLSEPAWMSMCIPLLWWLCGDRSHFQA